MNITKIITHNGQAHLDEITAISILLASSEGVPVIHRVHEVDPADLKDEETAVVDVGRQHDAGRLNLDHHQDVELPSSMYLAANIAGISDEAMRRLGYEFFDVADRRGRKVALSWAGHNGQFDNPLARRIIDAFSEAKSLQSHDWLYQMLLDVGGRILRYQTELEAAKKILDKRYSERMTLDEGGSIDIIEVEAPVRGALRDLLHDDEVVKYDVSVTQSDREEGVVVLWRSFDVEDLVDFRRIGGEPGVTFVHNAGFMACYREDRNTALRLIRKAAGM